MKALRRVLPALLAICYGIAWAWSSLSPNAGVVFFASVCMLASMPAIYKSIFSKAVISAMLGALILAFPCLAPLALIMSFVGIASIFLRIFKNAPLIIVGFMLYWGLSFAPSFVRGRMSVLAVPGPSFLLTMILFVVGFFVVQLLFLLLGILGYRRLEVAAFTFGLPGFFIIIFMSIISLGLGDGDLGGDHGMDSYAHYEDSGHHSDET